MFHRQQNLKIFVLLLLYREPSLSAWKFHEKIAVLQARIKRFLSQLGEILTRICIPWIYQIPILRILLSLVALVLVSLYYSKTLSNNHQKTLFLLLLTQNEWNSDQSLRKIQVKFHCMGLPLLKQPISCWHSKRR